jgi:hypothetical protein
MKPRIEELINREIDGETTPDESSELRTHLARDPESQAYYEDLRKVAGWLKRVPPVDAPSSLKPAIMSEVRVRGLVQKTTPAGASRRPFLERWFGGGLLFRPAYAWSAAAGFVAGFLVFVLLQGGLGNLDRSEISGTMGSASGTATRVELGPGGSEGSFTLIPEGTGVLGVLHLEGSAGTTASITYDENRVALSGIRWEGGAAEVDGSEPGKVRVGHDGSRSYTLSWSRLADGPTLFTVTTYLAGKEVEQTLRLP